MAKKICDGKVSVKKSRGKPRLIFENTVAKILEEGRVKSMRSPQRACMKRLMTVDEVKDFFHVETVAFGDSFSLTTPLRIQLCI